MNWASVVCRMWCERMLWRWCAYHSNINLGSLKFSFGTFPFQELRRSWLAKKLMGLGLAPITVICFLWCWAHVFCSSWRVRVLVPLLSFRLSFPVNWSPDITECVILHHWGHFVMWSSSSHAFCVFGPFLWCWALVMGSQSSNLFAPKAPGNLHWVMFTKTTQPCSSWQASCKIGQYIVKSPLAVKNCWKLLFSYLKVWMQCEIEPRTYFRWFKLSHLIGLAAILSQNCTVYSGLFEHLFPPEKMEAHRINHAHMILIVGVLNSQSCFITSPNYFHVKINTLINCFPKRLCSALLPPAISYVVASGLWHLLWALSLFRLL